MGPLHPGKSRKDLEERSRLLALFPFWDDIAEEVGSHTFSASRFQVKGKAEKRAFRLGGLGLYYSADNVM